MWGRAGARRGSPACAARRRSARSGRSSAALPGPAARPATEPRLASGPPQTISRAPRNPATAARSTARPSARHRFRMVINDGGTRSGAAGARPQIKAPVCGLRVDLTRVRPLANATCTLGKRKHPCASCCTRMPAVPVTGNKRGGFRASLAGTRRDVPASVPSALPRKGSVGSASLRSVTAWKLQRSARRRRPRRGSA